MTTATPTKTTENTSLIQARVRTSIKNQAAEKAETLGLPLSSIVTILLTDFAERGHIPAITVPTGYEDETPNAETLAAFEELDNGGGKTFKTAEAMFAELGI